MANKYANDNVQDAALDVIEEIFVEARKLEEEQSDITARLRDGTWTGRDKLMIHLALEGCKYSDWIMLLYMHKNTKSDFTAKEKNKLGFEVLSSNKKTYEENVKSAQIAIDELYKKGDRFGQFFCEKVMAYLSESNSASLDYTKDKIYMAASSKLIAIEAIKKAQLHSSSA